MTDEIVSRDVSRQVKEVPRHDNRLILLKLDRPTPDSASKAAGTHLPAAEVASQTRKPRPMNRAETFAGRELISRFGVAGFSREEHMQAALERVMQTYGMLTKITREEEEQVRQRLVGYLRTLAAQTDEQALVVEGLKFLRNRPSRRRRGKRISYSPEEPVGVSDCS